MSGMDELKLKYTEENPDRPSDDVETIAFHSTPHKPEATAKTVRRARPKTAPPAPPRKAVPLTMGLSRATPTPNGLAAAAWLLALAVAVPLASTGAVVVVPFLAAAVMLALGLTVRHATTPVLKDMERRFGLTVVDSRDGRVRFTDADGVLHEGELRVYGRRATLFDGDGTILSA